MAKKEFLLNKMDLLKLLFLIFDIGSDFWNGYEFLNDEYNYIYGLITIGILWLPGLFYAILLACCFSEVSLRKRIWISILALALAPLFPIILGVIIAAPCCIPKGYSSEKVQNLFILCALLEGALESSIQLNLQGYIMNIEQDYLKVGFFHNFAIFHI